jgi:multicomponent K+:H+ antiporter subunit D
MSHWIVAPVLLPAVVAGVLALGGDALPLRVQRAVGLLATAALVVVALVLLGQAEGGAHQVYALGDWRPPFGIALVLDRLSAVLVLLAAAVALCALVAACASGADAQGRYFHALFQFQLMGLSGAFLTGDLFNLFVFFEVLLIASYCLLLTGNTQARLRAGLHYVVVNLVGSSIFLIAVGLLYAITGTLNLADLAQKVPQLSPEDRLLVESAALLLLTVFALKAALFPLFLWLPSTYSAASAPVAALFAIMTKVGVYSILRVYVTVFGPAAGQAAPELVSWIVPAGLITVAWGALGALASRRLGTMAANLTLVSAGTVLSVAALTGRPAVSAALYYLVQSTLATALLFLLCGIIAQRRGVLADRLQRAGAAQPISVGIVFLLAVMTVVGAPPLSGFVGKLMLLQASLDAPQAGPIWAVLLTSSFVALLALTRAGMTLIWAVRREPAAQPIGAREAIAPALMLAGILVLTLAAAPVKRFMDATAGQLGDVQAYTGAVLTAPGRP